MKDQKKIRGFTHMFLYCSSPSSHLQAWYPFHVHVKWEGYPLPSSHDYSHWVYTPPTGYYSGHPWRLVSVSSSQCCRVILSNIPISLKIVFPKAYSTSSPLYRSPFVSPTLITTSSTLVLCRLMKDTSMPSFDGFHLVDFNTLSGIEI